MEKVVVFLGNGDSLYLLLGNTSAKIVQIACALNQKKIEHVFADSKLLFSRENSMAADDALHFPRLDMELSAISLDLNAFIADISSAQEQTKAIDILLHLLHAAFMQDAAQAMDILCLENMSTSVLGLHAKDGLTFLKALLLKNARALYPDEAFIAWIRQANFVFGRGYRAYTADSETIHLDKHAYLFLEARFVRPLFFDGTSIYIENSCADVSESIDFVRIGYLFLHVLKESFANMSSREILKDEKMRFCLAHAIYNELASNCFTAGKAAAISAALFEGFPSAMEFSFLSMFAVLKPSLKFLSKTIEKEGAMASKTTFILALLAYILIKEKAEGFAFLSEDMDPGVLSYAFLNDEELWQGRLSYTEEFLDALTRSFRDIQILGTERTLRKL